MKLSIVILNFKTFDLTSNCINAIEKIYSKYLNDDYIEIIVVDNASMDGSDNKLETKYSKLKNFILIKSKDNLGFGKGCNLGAKSAKGEYLLFLNSDTEIEDEGFIKMTEFMGTNSSVGILGGRLKNPDGTRQASAGSSYTFWNVFFLLLGFERLGFLRKSPTKTEKVSWVSGACMMVRKNVFEKIGGFEKELFMYMEDVDICFRARKMGYETYFFPDINLRHKELGSSNRTFAILNIYKGLLFFFKTHKPFWQYILVKEMLRTKAVFLVIFGQILNNKYLKDTYSEALKI